MSFDPAEAELIGELLGRSFMVYLVHREECGYVSAPLAAIGTMEQLQTLFQTIREPEMDSDEVKKKIRTWQSHNDQGMMRLN